jgi:hypothetical protein
MEKEARNHCSGALPKEEVKDRGGRIKENDGAVN